MTVDRVAICNALRIFQFPVHGLPQEIPRNVTEYLQIFFRGVRYATRAVGNGCFPACSSPVLDIRNGAAAVDPEATRV
jgi:hypothetical protein